MKAPNMERVRRALGSLNHDDLLLLILTRLEGLTVQETAEVLGMTTDAAAQSLNGVEEDLRRKMALDNTANKRASQ